MKNVDKINLAQEVLLELEALEGATLGLQESLATLNLALNAARRLAVKVKEEEERKAA